jgi:hypothetical protein
VSRVTREFVTPVRIVPGVQRSPFPAQQILRDGNLCFRRLTPYVDMLEAGPQDQPELRPMSCATKAGGC